jgi:hypothetical protein
MTALDLGEFKRVSPHLREPSAGSFDHDLPSRSTDRTCRAASRGMWAAASNAQPLARTTPDAADCHAENHVV